MPSRIVHILAFVTALAFVGCSPSLYVPTPADATPNASFRDLTNGRDIYTQKCGACHSLYLPERFSPQEWKSAVAVMQPKARITDEEKANILKYLLAGQRLKTAEIEQK